MTRISEGEARQSQFGENKLEINTTMRMGERGREG